MKIMRQHLVALILVSLVILLSACRSKDPNEELASESQYKVYYINSKTSGLESVNYEIAATEKEDQLKELFDQLKRKPDNVLYKSAIPETISVKEYKFNEDGLLTIDFDVSYSELTGIPEVLCRAAIVKTLCQIPGIDIVEFNINGQPLQVSGNTVVGFMTAEDFIDNTGSDTKVKLYYANEEGNALVEYIAKVNRTGTGTIEELVLNELIKGPTEIGMMKTIPEGTSLISVTTKEGLCTVNFNEKFLDKVPNVTDEIAIYSVVNTLVELPNINKVQFLINNETRKTYREGTAFDGIFERKLQLIEGSN